MVGLAQDHEKKRLKSEEEVSAIQSRVELKPKKARELIGRIPREPWIVHHEYFWNREDLVARDIYTEVGCDIGVARLEPFDPSWIGKYPILKNPKTPMRPGTSLCRLGFPFHDITATFDPATKKFTFENGVLPIPRFPNDGIHTQVIIWKNPDGTTGKFIQTSTPGLKGQSGGPIFDIDGNIWAVQSKTRSIPLDFQPTIKRDGKEYIEHQFMNVGMGGHVEELIRILDARGIKYQLSA
jgi:hypothetical protein